MVGPARRVEREARRREWVRNAIPAVKDEREVVERVGGGS